MYEFSVFLVFAFVGGVIGNKLKIPLGSMIGAMVSIGVFKSIGIVSFSGSSEYLFFLQIILGAMLGVTFIDFNKEYIKKIWIAVLFIFSGVVIMVTVISLLLVILFDFNGAVAILTSTPGAIYEMAMIAETISEKAPVVVLAHFARILIIMSLFSLLMHRLHSYFSLRESEKVL